MIDYRRLSNPAGSVVTSTEPQKWTANVVRDGKHVRSVSTYGTFSQARAAVDRKHPKATLIELIDGSGRQFAERFQGKWYAEGKKLR